MTQLKNDLQRPTSHRLRAPRAAPWLLFLTIAAMSVWGWHHTTQTLQSHAQQRFEEEASHLQHQIEHQFALYEEVLRGALGLLGTIDRVSREQWRIYVGSLNLAKNYPGIQGVGYAHWIEDAKDIPAHIARMRGEYSETYELRPQGSRDQYTAIVYLEPMDSRNARAIGYDMFSEATRRAAMTRAKDTGEAALSGKVRLVQETAADLQAGFLLYLPVYDSDAESVVPKIQGFVYSPFRADDMVSAVFSAQLAHVGFRIYDGSRPEADALLVDRVIGTDFDLPQFKKLMTVTYAGHPWTVEVVAGRSFEAQQSRWLPDILLLAGLICGALLSLIAWMLQSARDSVALRTREMEEQFEFSPDALITTDHRGRILRANAHAARLFKRRTTELLGESVFTLLPEMKVRLGKAYGPDIADSPAMSDIDISADQMEGKRKDGSVFQAEVRRAEMVGSAGTVLAVSVRDATARITTDRQIKRRTMELANQQALNELLLDSLSEAVIACSPEGQLTLWNQTARSWFDISSDLRPMIASDLSVYFYEGDADTAIAIGDAPLQRALDGQKITHQPVTLRLPGCPARLVLASGGPLIDASGEVLGAMVTLRDVTEAAQQELMHQQQERFLREVIDLNPNSIYARDSDGLFTVANQAVANTFGFDSADELVGNSDFRIQRTGETPEASIVRNREIIKDDQPVLEEIEITDVKGRRCQYRVAKRPIRSPDDSDVWVLSIATDITALKRHEEYVLKLNKDLEQRVSERTESLKSANELLERAKQEADQANQAKSSFLAAMSHEIRTPMNGIVGMVEVLSSQELPSDQADAVQTIRDSAFSLLRIIDDILDFSKIEAGKLELEFIPYAPVAVAESAVAALIPVALAKDVDLSVYVDPRVPSRLMMDPVRIRQLINNLTSNAIKFSSGRPSRRGRVQVRLAACDPDCRQLSLEVVDNGIGIPKEKLSTIFESFVQAESNTTRRFGGTGLGLAITKRLAELMGGALTVVSTEGAGSTFAVRFSTVAASDAEEQSDSIAAPAPACKYVIVEGEVVDAGDTGTFLPANEEGNRPNILTGMTSAVQVAMQQPDSLIVAQASTLTTIEKVTALANLHPGVRFLFLDRGAQRSLAFTTPNMVRIGASGIGRADFLDAVAIALGQQSPKTPDGPESWSAKTVRSERTERILVAEDDEINRKVIKRQLNLLGYSPTFAMDGKSALKQWRAGEFDLLITDLHMPRLDGYGLAEQVRRDEQGTGRRRPIVALTANALRGEERRAFSAGMDEYLTKPLELKHLEDALERHLENIDRVDARNQGIDKAGEAVVTAPTFDIGALYSVVGEDPEIAADLLRDYAAAAQPLVADVLSAGSNSNWKMVGSAAHRLKSSSRSVGCMAFGALCEALESACKAESEADLARCLSEFEGQYLSASRAIESWRAEQRA